MKKEPRYLAFMERFNELKGDMTQEEFAKKLGMSRPTVAFYCAGDRIPDALGVAKIAKICGVTSDWLLGVPDMEYDDAVTQKFSDRLRNIREEKGLSQAQLGEKIGVSRGAISYYENQSRVPDIRTLKKLATFFNVSTDWLLGLEEKDIPYERYKAALDETMEKLNRLVELMKESKQIIHSLSCFPSVNSAKVNEVLSIAIGVEQNEET